MREGRLQTLAGSGIVPKHYASVVDLLQVVEGERSFFDQSDGGQFLLNASLNPENDPAYLMDEIKELQLRKNSLIEAQYFVYKLIRLFQDQSSIQNDIRQDLNTAIENLDSKNNKYFSWNMYYNISLLNLYIILYILKKGASTRKNNCKY